MSPGERVGDLVLVEAFTRAGRSWWQCRCVCGATRAVRADNLAAGHAQSCGCFRREAPRAFAQRDALGRTMADAARAAGVHPSTARRRNARRCRQ